MDNQKGYTFKIQIRTGRTAYDLMKAGTISPSDFGVYFALKAEGKWGYVGKSNSRSWQEWADLFGMSKGSIIRATNRLKDAMLLYQIPNKSRKHPCFLVFDEALTKEELEHYIGLLKENNWTHVSEKTEAEIVEFVSDTEADEPPTPQPETEPQPAVKYYDGVRFYNGVQYHCQFNGGMWKVRNKDSEDWKRRYSNQIPEHVRDMFQMEQNFENMDILQNALEGK